ncbi:unknown [Eubacterium sp. CAG:202]|nr:unknown [Eubacterium sp. CAG:202]
MFFVNFSLFITSRKCNFARFHINRRIHTACVNIIYRAIAVAHTDTRIYSISLAICQNSINTDCVYGIGVDSAHIVMLFYHFFNNTDMPSFQFVIHIVKTAKIRFFQLVYTFAAAQIIRLTYNFVKFLHKINKFTFTAFCKIKPLAVKIIVKHSVKFSFIIKNMIVIRVIQELYNGIVYTSCHKCCPLFAVEIIKFTKQIILISCAVLKSAGNYIGEYNRSRFA